MPSVLASHRGALLGFFLDLTIAVVALLALSLLCGAAWGMFRGAQIVMEGGAPPPSDALMRMLGQPGAIATIWMTLISTGGAALLVYCWRRRASGEERARSMRALKRGSTWGWVLATAAATFVFSAAVSALTQHFEVRLQPTNQALIQAAFVSSPVFMLVFGTLIAPLYEELLFRRVLFGRLWAAGQPLLGVLLSSAAFALLHEIPGTTGNGWQATLALWVTYGFMGAAFAWVYWRTRTLWAAIAAHALNNGIALAVLKLTESG
jgi:membrane protease YdiL (CAAX protease family)